MAALSLGLFLTRARLRLQWRDASLDLMQQAKVKVLELIDKMNSESEAYRLRVTTTLRPGDGEVGYLHDMGKYTLAICRCLWVCRPF